MAAALVAAMCAVSSTTAGAAGGGFNCTSSSGSVSFNPGLLLKTAKPQKIGAASTVACTGGFVDGGSVTASVSSPNVRCAGLVGKSSAGTGKAVWSTPGMGKSTMKLVLKITSTGTHTASGVITGRVTTTGSNLGSGKAISGTFTIDKGLSSTLNGGDCTVTIPLTSAGITALAFHTV
ncbi:MAG: hypothetical protein JWM05_762 [Acidimicrobiales bacterium]|nr:hypothetical protein [Acidimicrobiales bacterium]